MLTSEELLFSIHQNKYTATVKKFDNNLNEI